MVTKAMKRCGARGHGYMSTGTEATPVAACVYCGYSTLQGKGRQLGRELVNSAVFLCATFLAVVTVYCVAWLEGVAL